MSEELLLLLEVWALLMYRLSSFICQGETTRSDEGPDQVKQTGSGPTLLPVSWDRYGFSSSPITE